MNRNFFVALLATLTLCSSTSFAQDSLAAKKNIVKLNVSGLLFKNASFQYERVVSPKMSLAMGVSLMPKTGLPFAGTLRKQFEANSDARRAIDDTRMSSFSITPEVRFYLGKKGAPRGLYLAPFARYNQLKLDQMYTFTPSDNQLHTANIKGTINNFGGGLMVGAQWYLSKSVTLDWWIAGPIVGSAKGDLAGYDPKGIPAQDRDGIRQDIESTDIPGYKLKADVGANDIKVDLSGTYYGLRAFGVALGIAF